MSRSRTVLAAALAIGIMSTGTSAVATAAPTPAVPPPGALATIPVPTVVTPVAPGSPAINTAPPSLSTPLAGAPAPVSGSEFGYLATHDLTRRARQMNVAQFIASLPVPPQFRAANLAFAARFDATVDSALASPGGCLQIVIDPRPAAGRLFDYGFFAVEGSYCD
ncbi:hypothetical protein [Williamsia sp. CHRR-6]|uniref:hypothetical protein n=1 Tax=Williamsia sp. CHRR-6 TaxID=2835871 RepID=UPI001BD96992|nr:hypothetical protein [Williamsia sp. CHRR-6]MBT0568317.1 hypothetical protein [Williamsia sp. CHRR-6]